MRSDNDTPCVANDVPQMFETDGIESGKVLTPPTASLPERCTVR